MRFSSSRTVMLLLVSAWTTQAQSSGRDPTVEFSDVPSCISAANRNAEAALEAANRWSEQDPGVDSQQCLSIVYKELGNIDQAIAAAERAAEIAEADGSWRAPGLWSDVALIAFASDRPDAALQYFDRALQSPELDNDMRGEILLDRAGFLAMIQEFGRAEADLVQSRALIPYNTGMWILSADVAFALQNFEAGADYLTRAYEADPTDAAIAFRAGEVAYSRGALEVARDAWGRALELEPNGPYGLAAARRLADTTGSVSPTPQS